jgi:membrane protease YdiL (CAAX protease family)
MLGWLRLRSGGVTLPIVTHAAFNVPAILVSVAGILRYH